MRREDDDFTAWRQRQANRATPSSYVYPQMPLRFRWCRRFAQTLFLIEWGGFGALVLSTLSAGIVALFWGKEALLEGFMALLLTLVFFVLLPLSFLARWLRHTAKLFWHCPCCGQPFPYYAPDGRHEEMREKECYYPLQQMLPVQFQEPAPDNSSWQLLLVDPDSFPLGTADLHHQLYIAVDQICVVGVILEQLAVPDVFMDQCSVSVYLFHPIPAASLPSAWMRQGDG